MEDRMLLRRQLLRAAGAAALASAGPRLAFALDYPTRSVRVVVPFPPGGAADITARLVGQSLSERLGQAFVIENKPGAGSNLGTEEVVRATPDGYTLLLVNTGNAINATLYKQLSFNFIRDIEPVGSLVQAPHMMFVTPSFPAKTVAEFIAYAKANPGKVNYASAGAGNANHISAEMFKMMTGIDMVHVPFNGGAPAVLALVAGQVQIMFADTLTAGEQVRAGTIRAIGVATPQRSPVLPDVPPISDTVPGFYASSWWGIGVPHGTAEDIVATLNAGINAALADAKIKERFAAMGALELGGTPDAFRKLIADETEKWGKVIRFANITAG
jgi:tripartite-type tricarboxylate transporter receptor subunit TctC